MYIILFILIFLIISYILFTFSKTTNIKIAQKLYESGNEINSIPFFIKSVINDGENIEELFDVVKTYRFGIGDSENGKNIKKANILLKHIVKNGTESQMENARMILKDIEYENIDNFFFPHLYTKDQISNQVKINPNLKFHKSHLHNDNPSINLQELKNQQELETALLNSLSDKSIISPFKITIKNDGQNVHDHILVRSMKTQLDKLQDNINGDYNLNEIFNYDLNTKQVHSLNKLLTGTDKLSSFNKSLYEILTMVWNRINHPDNIKHKQQLIDNLKFQLEDSYEVCAMGKATRILQTLEGIDDSLNIQIKPEWAIKQEMNNTALKIFTILNNKPEYKNIININEYTQDNKEKILLLNFKKEYEDELLKEFNIYNNLLSTEFITSKIKEYVSIV